MKTNLIIVLAVVAILVVGGGIYFFMQNQTPSGTSSGNNQQLDNNIEIKSFAFSPSVLTINVGETVVWTNKDFAPHTVTSETGNELDSPNFGRGGTYSHTFNTEGTFDYYCAIHPNMKGQIIVE